MTNVPRTQIRSGPAAVAIPDMMDPSQLHLPTQPPSVRFLPLTSLFDQHEVEIRQCVDGGDDIAKTISGVAYRLQTCIIGEIASWKNSVAHSYGVILSEISPQNPRKRAYLSDDADNVSLAPSRLEGDEAADGREYQCLYFEHDPDTYSHCGGKRYGRVSELRRHIKTHTLPHYCTKCGYRTAEERRLNTHKCEEGNRKKYGEVSEKEKEQHEKLARMGITVGEMRQVLFGSPKAGRKPVNSTDADNETVNSESSYRPPVSHTASNSSSAPTPYAYQNFANGVTVQSVNPLSHTTSPQNNAAIFHTTPPQAQTVFSSTSPEPFQHFTPPHHHSPYQPPQPGPMVHSPRRGEAASYYNDGPNVDYQFFAPSSPSGYPPPLSDGSTASPPWSNPSAHHTPQPVSSASYIYSPEGQTNPMQPPLDEFIHNMFPEVNPRDAKFSEPDYTGIMDRSVTDGFGRRPITPLGAKMEKWKKDMRQKSATFFSIVKPSRKRSKDETLTRSAGTFPPDNSRNVPGPMIRPQIGAASGPSAMTSPNNVPNAPQATTSSLERKPVAPHDSAPANSTLNNAPNAPINTVAPPDGMPHEAETTTIPPSDGAASVPNPTDSLPLDSIQCAPNTSSSSEGRTKNRTETIGTVDTGTQTSPSEKRDTSVGGSLRFWQRLKAATASPISTGDRTTGKTTEKDLQGPDGVAATTMRRDQQPKKGWADACMRLIRGWKKPTAQP